MQHAQRVFGRGELSAWSASDATTSDMLDCADLLKSGHDNRDGSSPQRLERKPEQRLSFAGGEDQSS